MKKWYQREQEAIEQDVVVSTRVRLARNFSDYPFENRLGSDQKYEVIGKVAGALEYANFGENKKLVQMDFEKMQDYERTALVEQHLISPEFAGDPRGKGLFLSSDHSISIMVNEEDHIRIQILSAGMDLSNALETANRIDDLFDGSLSYAFDEKLGFLTQCPTNLGTGLRASVMLHLPLLESTGYLQKLAANVAKLGLTIRGTYGEGTEAKGAYYQISNQVTLGISEESAINNLEAIVKQIILQERDLRRNANGPVMEDKIMRAYGVLSCARLMNSDEFMKLLSLIRLGVDYGYVPELSFQLLDELALRMGAASLCVTKGGKLNDEERDAMRADTVRGIVQKGR